MGFSAGAVPGKQGQLGRAAGRYGASARAPPEWPWGAMFSQLDTTASIRPGQRAGGLSIERLWWPGGDSRCICAAAGRGTWRLPGRSISNLAALAHQASGEPHAMEPRWRERLIRAAPENFTRRASGAAARDGRCVQQGRQPKEIPPPPFLRRKDKMGQSHRA